MIISKRGTNPRIRRFFATMLSALAVTGITACDLDVAPDPHFVDADVNPAALKETMVGAEVGVSFAYDLWIYNTGLFAGGITGTGQIRWNQGERIVNRDLSQASGLTGGGRDRRGPSVAYYAWLQEAIAASKNAQNQLLAGDFAGSPTATAGLVANPMTSLEFARLSLFSGFLIVWLADHYCELVLYAQPPVLSSAMGYQEAAREFQNVLDATNAEPEIRMAALAGLARVNRLLGDLNAARGFATQVDPDFEYVATYSTATFEQNNHTWFRLWSFGEHAVAPQFRGLTVDDTGVEDPRMLLVKNAVPPRGSVDDVWSPLKMPAAGSPIMITSGVEMLFIRAEAALETDLALTVTMINAARTERGLDIAWAPTLPLNHTEILDKLIDERRIALYLEGTLNGDTRYYIEKYGIDLFQTEIPQGFPVGDITCRRLPDREIETIEGLNYTRPCVFCS